AAKQHRRLGLGALLPIPQHDHRPLPRRQLLQQPDQGIAEVHHGHVLTAGPGRARLRPELGEPAPPPAPAPPAVGGSRPMITSRCRRFQCRPPRTPESPPGLPAGLPFLRDSTKAAGIIAESRRTASTGTAPGPEPRPEPPGPPCHQSRRLERAGREPPIGAAPAYGEGLR